MSSPKRVLVPLVLACVALGGCAFPSRAVRGYDGAERPDAELAIIRSRYDTSMNGIRVTLEKIDGEGLGFPNNVNEVRVLPGPHVVTVGFVDTGFGETRLAAGLPL